MLTIPWCNKRHKSMPLMALLISFMLIASPFLSMPPRAEAATPGWVYDLQVNAVEDNTTITATADYVVTFSVDEEVNPQVTGTAIYLRLDPGPQGFDLSGVTPAAVKLEFEGDDPGEFEEDEDSVISWDVGTKTLEIVPSETIDADKLIKVKIPEVKNPDTGGNKWFVDVWVDNDFDTSNTAQGNINITAPILVIEPDLREETKREVNLRNLITISLQDELGDPVKAPSQINQRIRSYSDGQFYPDKADEEQDPWFTISQGESQAQIYYRPTRSGDHVLYVNSFWYQGANIAQAESGPFTVSAFRSVLQVETYGPITAGEKALVEVRMRDEHQEELIQEGDLDVYIKALVEVLNDETGEWETETPVNGKFYIADENNDPTGDEVEDGKVTIKEGESSAFFYYYDETAGEVEISAEAGELSGSGQVTVEPGKSEKIILDPVADAKTAKETFVFNAYLVDEFGNKTGNQPPSLSINLYTSSQTGTFYSDAGLDNPIEQLTFSPGWNWESQKTFYYKDSTPAEGVEIWANDAREPGDPDYLTGSEISKIDILEAVYLSMTPASLEPEIFLNNKVELELMQGKEPYVAAEDIRINLNSDNDGKFYLKQANNEWDPWDPTGEVTIPAGESSAVVYYRAQEVGEHNLRAYNNTALGGLDAEAVVDVQAAGQVSLHIISDDDFEAGSKTLVEVQVRDQYGKPVKQESDLEVAIGAWTEVYDEENEQVVTAAPEKGSFYEADEDGEPTDDEITDGKAVIKEGDSSVKLYYYDETAAQVRLEAGAPKMSAQRYMTVLASMADKVQVESKNGTALTTHEIFELEVTLLDRYGNQAADQYAPLNLRADSDCGYFYNNLQEKKVIKQFSFEEDYSKKTVYYHNPVAGDVTLTIGDDNLEDGTIELTILPLPALVSVTTGVENWIINRRGLITVTLLDEEGEGYQVPEEMEEGMDILLATSPLGAGSFFSELKDGDTLHVVNIPAGESSVQVYFAARYPGDIEVTAAVSGPDKALDPSTEGGNVFAVSPADRVQAAFGLEEYPGRSYNFIAGEVKAIEIVLLDMYGNTVEAEEDLVIQLKAEEVVPGEDPVPRASGKFYATEEATSEITGVTIPEGETGITVYYQDTRVTGYQSQVYLVIQPETCTGDRARAYVNASAAHQLGLSFLGDSYTELMVYDTASESSRSYSYGCYPSYNGYPTSPSVDCPAWEGMLPGQPYTILVEILDEHGNVVQVNTEVTVQLDTTRGKFYGDYSLSKPITEVTFSQGYKATREVVLVPKGAGEVTMTASANGYEDGVLEVGVAAGNEFAAYSPYFSHEDDAFYPEERKQVILFLRNKFGQPAVLGEAVTLDLTGTNAAFYSTWDEDCEPLDKIEAPAGYHGVLVYVEAGDLDAGIAEGTGKIQATPAKGQDLSQAYTGTGQLEFMIKLWSHYVMSLSRGWNMISAPLQLEEGKDSLEGIIEHDECIELIYIYSQDHPDGPWVLVGKDYTLRPMEAAYVKMSRSSRAHFYAYRDISGPYTRTMVPGWNLMGPALDLTQVECYHEWIAMPVHKVLASIESKYSQALSQAINQDSWAYVPKAGDDHSPFMEAGKGYWVWMTATGTLAGFSATPVPLPFMPRSYPEVATDSPPPIPAAFTGTVVDQNDGEITAGTIEAVVNGVVRGTLAFEDGVFGLSQAAYLIVQSNTSLRGQDIEFYINGYKAAETIRWSSATGKLTEITLTIDSSAEKGFVYQAVSLREDGRTISLKFSQEIENNLEDMDALKAAITYTRDGIGFTGLSPQDKVEIQDNKLVITLVDRLIGNLNQVKLPAGAIRAAGDPQLENGDVLTPYIRGTDEVIDECFIATAAYGSKFQPAVALLRQFRDQYLLANPAGQYLVALYYQYSPPVAQYIASSSTLRLTARALLTPAAVAVYLLLHPALLLALALTTALALAAYRRKQYHPQARDAG